jgi:tetratricopeptide (TPR) repeat protein
MEEGIGVGMNEYDGFDDLPPLAPLDQAQELIYRAWEEPGKRERKKLARQALELSADCADAYVILAEDNTETLVEALIYYEAGVQAGRRAIGEKMFAEETGYFWGILETRPYMRARGGLANTLWELGRRQEAIDHYWEMLRLNKQDNQGIRYILAVCLLEDKRDDELGKLLSLNADDGMAMLQYARALLAFRREGPSREAGRYLQQAIKSNPHVPAYILGLKRIPKERPLYLDWGGEREAAYVASEVKHIWWREEGAIRWLRDHAS